MTVPRRPLSREPVSGPRDGDLPAYLGNGLIGIRVREVPLFAGMVLISGLAGAHPERGIEAAAAAPYLLSGDLAIDGVLMSEQPWAMGDLRQSYDFATAELQSAFTYQVGTQALSVEVVTFASRTAPSIVAQEVRVTADGPCDLKFRAVVSIAGLTRRIARRRTDTPGEPEPACDGSLLWETAEALGQCGLALATEVPAAAGRQILTWSDAGPLCTEYGIRLASERPVRFRQLAALAPPSSTRGRTRRPSGAWRERPGAVSTS
ncbi:hypothetical protein [Brevundimonas sp.]|uniref:hypothetical protein n=1 Tax=Brevundimonas sp. TaxID=1871086 RepID=UPI0028ADAFD1|nr:hypothetical protein [Brevundimonas sp.]